MWIFYCLCGMGFLYQIFYEASLQSMTVFFVIKSGNILIGSLLRPFLSKWHFSLFGSQRIDLKPKDKCCDRWYHLSVISFSSNFLHVLLKSLWWFKLSFGTYFIGYLWLEAPMAGKIPKNRSLLIVPSWLRQPDASVPTQYATNC